MDRVQGKEKCRGLLPRDLLFSQLYFSSRYFTIPSGGQQGVWKSLEWKGREWQWLWQCQPPQHTWGGRQELAGNSSGTQAVVRSGGRFSPKLGACSHCRWPAAPLASSTQPFSLVTLLSTAELRWNVRLWVQPGTIPICVRMAATADFLLVALEISLQKGCFGCFSLIYFSHVFACFQGEDWGLLFSFWGCWVFFYFTLG